MTNFHSTMPTLNRSQLSFPKKERVAGFYEDLVDGLSHPSNTLESWPAYNFELHALKYSALSNDTKLDDVEK